MKNYFETIGKSALATGLVTVSYVVGLNQNPTFSELPSKAQEAIVETHHDLDTLLTQAVDYYTQGNSKRALEIYRQVEQEAETLEKIDPSHEETRARMFQYGAAIIDTENIVTNCIDPFYEHILTGTPQRIAEYVATSNLPWWDGMLETIGPESGAYSRLEGDKIAQIALLKYYVDYSLKWDFALGQMRDMLENSPNKTEPIEVAIGILTDKKNKREINH